MSVLITAGILALLLLWALAVYNRLVRLRRRVTSGWREVDVHLKRRRDQVQRVATVLDGTVPGDPDVIASVSAASHSASRARGPADASVKERELSAALVRLIALAAVGTQPSGERSLRALREELAGIENAIGPARDAYNQLARDYNAALEVAPANVIAGVVGFKRAEIFEY